MRPKSAGSSNYNLSVKRTARKQLIEFRSHFTVHGDDSKSSCSNSTEDPYCVSSYSEQRVSKNVSYLHNSCLSNQFRRENTFGNNRAWVDHIHLFGLHHVGDGIFPAAAAADVAVFYVQKITCVWAEQQYCLSQKVDYLAYYFVSILFNLNILSCIMSDMCGFKARTRK